MQINKVKSTIDKLIISKWLEKLHKNLYQKHLFILFLRFGGIHFILVEAWFSGHCYKLIIKGLWY